MIAYNDLDVKRKFPKRSYDYILGFIHGFTIGLIPISIYLISKRNK
jgi:hypothetical protein